MAAIAMPHGLRLTLQAGCVVFAAGGLVLIGLDIMGQGPSDSSAVALSVVGVILLAVSATMGWVGFGRPVLKDLPEAPPFIPPPITPPPRPVALRCRKCGNLERETAQYCSVCGERL